MSPLNTPTPKPTEDVETEAEDSLEALRAKLVAQRAARKVCLEKHKRTTFMATETAKSTTFFDPQKLQERLTDASQEEDETAADS
jgi:hypothetical protein